MVEKERTRKKISRKRSGINFVKDDTRRENIKGWKASVLDTVEETELRVDLDKTLVFSDVVDTSLIYKYKLTILYKYNYPVFYKLKQDIVL